MHPRFVPIDPEALRVLYLDEGLTTTQIAARLACGATTIGRRLRGFSISRRPRGPVPLTPRPGEVSTSTTITWSTNVAYAIGLITTDGNLSSRPGRLELVSKDADLLDTVRRCLHLTVPMTPHASGYGGGPCYRVSWSDRRFYDALLTIGLTPAKSRTLGALRVPDEYFADFFRGCIDGDGSIVVYVDRYNVGKDPRYVYTRLYVSLVSASPRFLVWLRETMLRLRGLRGSLGVSRSRGRSDIWRLRYAKRESLALVRWMYYAPSVPCLGRKLDKASPFLAVPTAPRSRRPGRPMIL